MVHGIVRIVPMVAVMASVTWADAAPPAPKTAPATETAPAGKLTGRAPAAAAPAAADGRININTASVKELMALDGVGRKLAEKIVEYRTTHGQFKKAADIRKVDGFGGGLWEKNRARVVVE
jgi:competence ComEA-like helix-hairpin-helix protein